MSNLITVATYTWNKHDMKWQWRNDYRTYLLSNKPFKSLHFSLHYARSFNNVVLHTLEEIDPNKIMYRKHICKACNIYLDYLQEIRDLEGQNFFSNDILLGHHLYIIDRLVEIEEHHGNKT